MRIFRPQPQLAVAWTPSRVSLFLFEKSKDLKFGSFGSIQEAREFLDGPPPRRTLLVIPRSEVLQKEMTLEAGNLAEKLESRVAQVLPYSPQEMAYSIALDSTNDAATKALLYAIPGQKIKEILESLIKAGIRADEAVSEDQALFWLFREKAEEGPVLVLDRAPDRTLFLVCRESAILLSGAYPPDEDIKSVLSEISFSLLEAGVKPVKVITAGGAEIEEAAKALEIPAERWEFENLDGAALPLVLSGARRWGACPAISLLPKEEKLLRHGRRQKRLLRANLLAFGAFLACFAMLAAGHLFLLEHKKAALQKEASRLASQAAEIRQITRSLAALEEAERSKRRLLSFLKEVAVGMPSSVRLKELRVEEKKILLQGESPSHALLSETVQIFERIEGVKEAKLEYARLRKRLNQDYFNFEVTARWQP